jgi:hypothetical protein
MVWDLVSALAGAEVPPLKGVERPRKPNCLKKNDNFLSGNDTPGGPVCKSGPPVTLPSLLGGVSLEGHTGGFSPPSLVQSIPGFVINGRILKQTSGLKRKSS